MRTSRSRFTHLTALLAAGLVPLFSNTPARPDNFEFQPGLVAPFKGTQGEGRIIKVAFKVQGAQEPMLASWRLELVNAKGTVLRWWHGEAFVADGDVIDQVAWDGRDLSGRRLPAGFYTLRLKTMAQEQSSLDAAPGGDMEQRVTARLAQPADETFLETEETIQVGSPAAPSMPRFKALALAQAGSETPARFQSTSRVNEGFGTQVAATASLPYTVYYGTLHSHTKHSDGGVPVSSCGSGESPWGGTYGPTDAYTYAQNSAGMDFLATTDHNHMYDGSSGTATSLPQSTALNLFQTGLSEAASYRAAHPSFVAIYGNEWGTLATGGGHLNILNGDGLVGWEYNSSNQLFGDHYVAKGDYASLYSLMQQHGWIGQFNHPSSSQFAISSSGCAYNANGAQVMYLCEVLNSSAFSSNTGQTETGRSTYTGAWNTLLSRGYKLAPSSDQDNHCANWGNSYTNRTGVLIPAGQAPTLDAFMEAVRARRVFATADKAGQIILTANGHVMGESFGNSGSLTLTVNYASTSGQTASSVEIYHGVPGSNGSVSQLVSGQGTYTLTPANGEHFYYAVVTQANGCKLWSAPVWVSQGAAPTDTTAPTVSGSVNGTSGSITLAATATDNTGGTGVAKVEFLVDGNLAGSDTTSPYSLVLDSTTLSNGSHTLVARATDGAGNVGTSSTVSFTVSNTTTDTTAPVATAGVSGTSGIITLSASATDNTGGTGVSKVDFYVDGTLKGSDASSPYSMTLDSNTLANGSHTLVAKATDGAGNVGTSAGLAFTVSNTTSDTTAPTATASVSGTSGTITFSATATDNTGGTGVSKVDFYVDGALKGSDSSSPYSMTLDSTTLANGSHTLVAKATDGAGNVGSSSSVSFSVSNVSATFTETESNNSVSAADVVDATVTKIVGAFPSTSDSNDYFAVSVGAGRTLSVNMSGPSGPDYDLYIVNSSGTKLSSSESSGTTESVSYKNTATTAKTFYIRVYRYSGSSTTSYNLTLSR